MTPHRNPFSKRLTIGLGVLVTMATLGGGYLATNHHSGSSEPAPAALPKLANPLPVLQPMWTGTQPPVFTKANPLSNADSATPTRWVQPEQDPASGPRPAGRPDTTSPAGSDPTSTGLDATSSSSTDARRGRDAATSGEAGALPGAPDGLTVVDDGEHDDDPCAPTDGSAPADGCPSGLHSVVLALESVAPLDLWVRDDPPAPGPVANWTMCEQQRVSPGAVIGFSSNNPIAEGRMTWWDVATPDDVHEVSFSDSEPVQRFFDAGRRNDDFAYSAANRLQHCIVLDGLEPGHTYVTAGQATDMYGSVDETDPWHFTSNFNDQHPPTLLSPYNGALLVVGYSKPGSHLESRAIAVGDAGDPRSACQQMRDEGRGLAAGDRSTEAETVASRRLEHSDLFRPGYLYDPAFSQVTNQRFDDLIEGTQYSICVTRVEDGAPSFDRRAMADAEVFTVVVPNRLRTNTTIDRVDASSDVRRITSWITGAGHPESYCGFATYIAGSTDPRAPVCDQRRANGSLAAFSRGLDLHMIVDTGSRVVESTIRLDVAVPTCSGPCPGRAPEWFTVPLPEVRVGTGMCQDPCDPPTRLRLFGSMLVKVSFSDGPTGGGIGWQVSASTPVATSGALRGTSPVWDTTLHPEIGPGPSPTLTVPIRTDRPTRARLEVTDQPARWLDAHPGGGPCLRPGGSATTEDTAFALTHTLVLNGLCTGYRYGLKVVVVAEDGTSTSYGWGDDVTTPWSYGIVAMPTYQAHVSAQVAIGTRPRGTVVEGASVLIGDPTRAQQYGLDRTTPVVPCDDGYNTVDLGPTYGLAIPLEDQVQIEVVAEISTRRNPENGRCRGNDDAELGRQHVRLTATVALTDLAARPTVSLRSDRGAPFEVTARLTLTDFALVPVS